MRFKSISVLFLLTSMLACHNRRVPETSNNAPKQSSSRDSNAQPDSAAMATNTGTTPVSGAPKETPIDVNAMLGDPPMNAEEAALAKKVKDKLASDQRITSKRLYVGVTHSENGSPTKDPVVRLAGSVASEDEMAILTNDIIKMQEPGWKFGILSVSVDPSLASSSARASQSVQALGPWSEPRASKQPNIPLCAGLTVVTAIASQGDYESIKTVESMDGKSVRLKYSTETTRPWWEIPPAQRNCEPNAPGCAITSFVTHRTVRSSDLESAHKYDQIFVTASRSPELALGTTAIGTSAEVLRELKEKGESEIELCAFADDSPVITHDNSAATPDQTHEVPGGCHAWGSSIDVKRVGNQPVYLRVLVDGAPVDLPAVQAKGMHGPNSYDDRDEFFFLDDERNPLTLEFRLGIGGMVALSPYEQKACAEAKEKGNFGLDGSPPRSCDYPDGGDRDVLKVTKITTKCEVPRPVGVAGAVSAGSGASALEKALAETGKVDIYSIYFSFNSDKLRDESQPTLKDIVEVLRRHPNWKLQVNGHTDGIGGDQFNLDLSKRRAAAVKNALVQQYKVVGSRLATAGFGKSQPKDTNDTLEGRARNRRVELMKIS